MDEAAGQLCLLTPGYANLEGVNKLRGTIATVEHENGATVLAPANPQRPTPLDVRMYAVFLLAGLVPPKYGLHLADIHLNSVLLLAILMHLCEMFVSIQPSIALFCHFYYPRIKAGTLAGLVAFHQRERLSEHFIIIDKKKNEEW
jgi:hypothetical protein